MSRRQLNDGNRVTFDQFTYFKIRVNRLSLFYLTNRFQKFQ
ncbi:hypothetical protein [Leptospira kirschneri]|nr:hypothetical protein [Leptospira kirschneri]